MSLKTVLKETALYYRLRTSTVHDLYWMVADPKSMHARRAEINFYQELLTGFQKGSLIFDVGANLGGKTEIFLRLGARVVAVEPNDYCRRIMAAKFFNHRLIKKPVTLVNKAIGECGGTETMWIDGPGSGLNTFNPKWAHTLQENPNRIGIPVEFGRPAEFRRQEKIEMVTLEDLINEHGTPFFIKIDVEGYEPNVLRGLRRKVPFISFEVNLPEFRTEGLECIERLEQISSGGLFNFAEDTCGSLALPHWLPSNRFIEAFDRYRGTGAEVFWKS